MGKKKQGAKGRGSQVDKLLIAAEGGNCRNIKRVLEAGCDVNAYGSLMLTPRAEPGGNDFATWIAEEYLSGEPVQYVSVTALHVAVYYSQESATGLLLDSGADPDAFVGCFSASGFAARFPAPSCVLSAAAARGHIGILRRLLAAGATADPLHGGRAFLFACVEGHVECAEALAQTGGFNPADVKNLEGRTGPEIAEDCSAHGISAATVEQLQRLVSGSEPRQPKETDGSMLETNLETNDVWKLSSLPDDSSNEDDDDD